MRSVKSDIQTKHLVVTALLVAIEILFAFTPIGYLKVGVISITFLTIPVAIGAMLVGKWASLLLGTVFGITSFVQCFGMDAFGTTMFGVNPVGTFILCIVTRALMGFLVGVIFELLGKEKLYSFIIAAFSAAFLNTLLFVGCFYLFFHAVNLVEIGFDVSSMSIIDVLVAMAGVNGLVEMGVVTVFASAIGKVLQHATRRF